MKRLRILFVLLLLSLFGCNYFIAKIDASVTINKYWNEYGYYSGDVDFYINFSITNKGTIPINDCTVTFKLTYSDNTIHYVDVEVFEDIDVGETYTTTEWIFEVNQAVIDATVTKIELENWSYGTVTIEF